MHNQSVCETRLSYISSTISGLGGSLPLQSSSPNKRVQKDPVAASFFLASRARARIGKCVEIVVGVLFVLETESH